MNTYGFKFRAVQDQWVYKKREGIEANSFEDALKLILEKLRPYLEVLDNNKKNFIDFDLRINRYGGNDEISNQKS
jgi:hypothetical protein